MKDPRWNLLDVVGPRLVDSFADRGVVQVRYVAAFPLDGFAVWLCTTNDQQRNRLNAAESLVGEVRRVLLAVGFAPDQLVGLTAIAQAQETVDRDYEGNWFYALR